MTAKLLSLILGPLVRAFVSVVVKFVRQELAYRDVHHLRKNKEKLEELQRSMDGKKHFTDKEAAKNSAILADIMHGLR